MVKVWILHEIGIVSSKNGKNVEPLKDKTANVEAFLAETMERATQPAVSQSETANLSEESKGKNDWDECPKM